MKMLILGGHGMAGHMITAYFQRKAQYDVYYTSRDAADQKGLYLDVTDSKAVEDIINRIQPHITINCVGILNEAAAQNPTLAFQVNSLLPHQLVKLTERYGGRLVHISTDCVFSGVKGNYTEADTPDGTSSYAQSKQAGEIISDKHVTIRTSIIGPELKENGIGLFLWFMKQTGEIKGYEKVLWNGVTTLELAKAIERLLEQNVTGLYQLGAKNKISKYALLQSMQKVFEKKDVTIVKDSEIILDRTIVSTRTDFHYEVPDYEQMLIELREWMESK